MTVLQLVVFNVEPESLHDAGTRLRVHAQQSGQTGVQFVLRRLGTDSNHSMAGTPAERARKSRSRCMRRYLVIQHEQEGAFDVDVTGPFHLEPIRLLSGGHSVPLQEGWNRRLKRPNSL